MPRSDAEVILRGSPNFGPRPSAARISFVVLHHTAMESAEAALARLCEPSAEVSCHYLIDEAGALFALVPEEARAWHAGKGHWRESADLNSVSIGVELVNPGPLGVYPPYAARQMARLERLLADLLARHRLPAEAVIGHSDLAPLRKDDPGPKFDWQRLARHGLSVWPNPQGLLAPDPARFRGDARRFGYGDWPDGALLAAFRLRFRPYATGLLEPEDMAAMADLAARFGA